MTNYSDKLTFTLSREEMAKAIADQTVAEDSDGYTKEKWYIARDASLAMFDLINETVCTQHGSDYHYDGDILSETLSLLRNAPRHISFAKMSTETGCSVSWISRLAAGKISDPSIRNIQSLFNYLKRIND